MSREWDVAENKEGSETPDVMVCKECGRDLDGELSESETRKIWREVALRFQVLFENSGNPLLTARALPFAFGLPTTGGKSAARVADEIKLGQSGRQIFNKEVRRLQRLHKIRNNRNNKSAEAQAKSKERALNDHWRNQDATTAAKSAICRAAKSNAD
jgi:hypothetical protein